MTTTTRSSARARKTRTTSSASTRRRATFSKATCVADSSPDRRVVLNFTFRAQILNHLGPYQGIHIGTIFCWGSFFICLFDYRAVEFACTTGNQYYWTSGNQGSTLWVSIQSPQIRSWLYLISQLSIPSAIRIHRFLKPHRSIPTQGQKKSNNRPSTTCPFHPALPPHQSG